MAKGTPPTPSPGLSILRKPAGPAKTKPGAPEEGEKKETKKRLTELEAELNVLRKDVEKEEDDKGKPRRKDKNREPGRTEATPRKKNFEGGPLPMKRGKPDGGGDGPSDSSGAGSDGSGGSSSQPGESMGSVDWGGESTPESDKKKRKKKKRKKKAGTRKSRSSEDDKKGERRKAKSRKKPSKDEKRKKEKKKKKDRRNPDKSRKRGSEKLEKDKGPFGMGETKKMLKDEEEDSESLSETSDSSQSFRKAPSGLTLHLRLQRYAMRHPGRLATRPLQRMEKVCRLGGASGTTGKKVVAVKPCALAYFLTILTPSLKDRWMPRTQRELRVSTYVCGVANHSDGLVVGTRDCSRGYSLFGLLYCKVASFGRDSKMEGTSKGSEVSFILGLGGPASCGLFRNGQGTGGESISRARQVYQGL